MVYQAEQAKANMKKNMRVGLLVAWTWMSMAGTNGEPVAWMESQGQPLLEEAVTAFVHPPVPALDRSSFRVAFYNLETFTDGIKDGEDRTEALAKTQAADAAAILAEVNADILLISEIENARALIMLNDALADPYPAGYVVRYGTGSSREENMNAAMLTRHRPDMIHELDFGPLTGSGRPTRGFFRATFDLGDDHHLVVYGGHLKSNWGNMQRNYSQRYHALRMMRDDAATLMATDPDRKWEMLLLADFNSDPLMPKFADDPTWTIMGDWIDLWADHPEVSNLFTVPSRLGDPELVFPPALFDRIVAHPALREAPWVASLPGVVAKGADTENVHTKPGRHGHVSDHYPVYVDITR